MLGVMQRREANGSPPDVAAATITRALTAARPRNVYLTGRKLPAAGHDQQAAGAPSLTRRAVASSSCPPRVLSPPSRGRQPQEPPFLCRRRKTGLSNMPEPALGGICHVSRLDAPMTAHHCREPGTGGGIQRGEHMCQVSTTASRPDAADVQDEPAARSSSGNRSALAGWRCGRTLGGEPLLERGRGDHGVRPRQQHVACHLRAERPPPPPSAESADWRMSAGAHPAHAGTSCKPARCQHQERRRAHAIYGNDHPGQRAPRQAVKRIRVQRPRGRARASLARGTSGRPARPEHSPRQGTRPYRKLQEG